MIKVISLRRDHDNSYNLFYYFKGNRTLQPEIYQWIESLPGSRSDSEVEIEFFARLTFESPSNTVKIMRMEGEWYDLNGNIDRLLDLLSELDNKKKIDATQQDFAKRLLSEIGTPSFGASMGTITFARDA